MGLNRVREIDDRVLVRTALISVWDKTGLDTFVSGLLSASPGVKILSTGGTYTALERILGSAAGATLSPVSAYTGQPEMQGGLVKTLDFKIYLGLLSETYNPAHQEDLRRTGAAVIDMVVVNLYPFRDVVAAAGVSSEDARGNIDIGGPCMVRAAAKNFHRVAAVTDAADYEPVVRELRDAGGALSLETRFRLARKAFALTAGYDAAISAYLSGLAFQDAAVSYAVRGS